MIDKTPVDELHEIDVYLGLIPVPPGPQLKKGENPPINIERLRFMGKLILKVGELRDVNPSLTNGEIRTALREAKGGP